MQDVASSLFEWKVSRIEIGMRFLPVGEIAGFPAIIGNLAGKGLEEQRMPLEAVEKRQQLGALAGNAKRPPKGRARRHSKGLPENR